jgi:hypothetical protein
MKNEKYFRFAHLFLKTISLSLILIPIFINKSMAACVFENGQIICKEEGGDSGGSTLREGIIKTVGLSKIDLEKKLSENDEVIAKDRKSLEKFRQSLEKIYSDIEL